MSSRSRLLTRQDPQSPVPSHQWSRLRPGKVTYNLKFFFSDVEPFTLSIKLCLNSCN